jgi:hypothetical protein
MNTTVRRIGDEDVVVVGVVVVGVVVVGVVVVGVVVVGVVVVGVIVVGVVVVGVVVVGVVVVGVVVVVIISGAVHILRNAIFHLFGPPLPPLSRIVTKKQTPPLLIT